jgi:hypothetical protein
MYRRSILILVAAAFALFATAFPATEAVATDNHGSKSSVVGMWLGVLKIGRNGPVFDEVFQQFHSDGTENIISNGLPPALGNTCSGLWERVGSRTYKLKHFAWNWSQDLNPAFEVQGTFAGHFELEMTLHVDERGKTYKGTWSAKNFDPSGNHIASLDASGVVHATRITLK